MVGTLLTVVVPTIPGRESLLSRCLHSITVQARDGVDVLVVDGPGRLGDKVNAASATVGAGWMTVVDDDDWVVADYVASVLLELVHGPDYVGLKVLEMENGRFARVTATSAEFNRWGSAQRGPVPKGITRVDIVRRVSMGNDYRADRAWLRAVSPLIETWRFVDRPLYVYDWWNASSAFYDGGARDVGVWPFDESRITRLTVA